MGNKKPKIFLSTLKKCVLLGVGLLFGFALIICHDYFAKRLSGSE